MTRRRGSLEWLVGVLVVGSLCCFAFVDAQEDVGVEVPASDTTTPTEEPSSLPDEPDESDKPDERPLLCYVMIVKNEERGIRKTIQSVVPFIDQWFVLDTGSTDNTPKIVRQAFRGKRGKLSFHPFEDFSSSRNRVIDDAGTSCQYLLMLSGDETLEEGSGKALREYLAERQFDPPDPRDSAFLVKVRFGQEENFYDSCRVWRSGLDWHYVGVTHEYITKDGVKPAYLRIPDVVIHHELHPEDDRTKRWELDVSLLRNELRSNPDDCRSRFYLAQSYEMLGKFADAMHEYRKRVDCGGWFEEVYEAMVRAAKNSLHIGRPWAEVQQMYLEAYSYNPIPRAEPLFEIAKYYQQKEEYNLAYIFAKATVEVPFPEEATLLVDRAVYECHRHDVMAIACYWTQRYKEGIDHARKALATAELYFSPSDGIRLADNLRFFEERFEDVDATDPLNDDQ